MKDLDKVLIASMNDDDLNTLLDHLCDSLSILRKYVYSITNSDEILRLTLLQIHVFEELKHREKNKQS